jgi:hypothetical protein
MEQIYALYYEWEDERKYFYVGRTGRDPAIRKNEHRLKSKSGTEDVYKFIRERLQPSGIDVWDMELLESDNTSSYEDCEDFWVVLMIRAGHDLKNMKHGDAQKIAALYDLADAAGDFATVREFSKFRRQVEQDNYERSERLKASVAGMVDSPRGDLADILTAAKQRYALTDRTARERRIKKEARDRANALEKQEWLGSMRNLFEIPSDSVDKQ